MEQAIKRSPYFIWGPQLGVWVLRNILDQVLSWEVKPEQRTSCFAAEKLRQGQAGRRTWSQSRQLLGWGFGAAGEEPRLDRDSDSYARPRPLRMHAPNPVGNESPKLILGSNVLSSHGPG